MVYVDLQSFLTASEMKPAQFARSVGLSRAYVSELLSGAKSPGLATAFKIERATDGAVPVSAWAASASISSADAERGAA